MNKFKLAPIESTREMCLGAGCMDQGCPAHYSDHQPAPEVAKLVDEPEVGMVGFCEDVALSLAERTFSTEIDEKLAEDVIQYARRLHELYTTLKGGL